MSLTYTVTWQEKANEVTFSREGLSNSSNKKLQIWGWKEVVKLKKDNKEKSKIVKIARNKYVKPAEKVENLELYTTW